MSDGGDAQILKTFPLLLFQGCRVMLLQYVEVHTAFRAVEQGKKNIKHGSEKLVGFLQSVTCECQPEYFSSMLKQCCVAAS